MKRVQDGDRQSGVILLGSVDAPDLIDQINEFVSAIDRFKKSPGPTEKRFWLFQANPDYYDICGALSELPEISWLVAKHQSDIQKGHEVFLWESGRQGGLIGRGEIVSDPAVMADNPPEEPFRRNREKLGGEQVRVLVRVDQRVTPRCHVSGFDPTRALLDSASCVAPRAPTSP